VELLRDLLAFPGRTKFRWKNRRRARISDQLQRSLKDGYDKAKAHGLEAYADVYNVALFIALAERDTSAYSEAIFVARSEWHRQFHARGLAVLLFELSEDLPELLGGKYRARMRELSLEPSWFDRLNEATAKLAAFRREHTAFLKRVRTYVGAHRDHDAVAQLEVLTSLGPLDVYSLAPKLSVPLRELIAFNTELLGHLGKPSVVLQQLSKRPRP
jgi:hypothetical protein